MKKQIFTIGRQYGSGGREIGKKLAERLEIPFYDKDLLTMVAKEGGFDEKVLEQADERSASSLLYSMVTSLGSSDPNYLPLNDRLFIAQSKVIKRVASEGSCVIVGRCADYILREDPACINIFIHAPLSYRIRRIRKLYELSEAEAQTKIIRTDKQRASYTNHYADQKWGKVDHFHLAFDASSFSTEDAVSFIQTFAELRK